MKEALTFDDVLIRPRFSTVESRKDVSLYSFVPNLPAMGLPLISSNMDRITGADMARTMLSYGAQACLHRFQSIEENVKMFKDSHVVRHNETRQPAVSVGLGKLELERAEALANEGALCFIIDVANGASLAVVNQVKELRTILGQDRAVIAGNFATSESVITFLGLLNWKGVNGIKVGIGPGSICKTRLVTGCGYPQLSAIMGISKVLKNKDIALIADGGMSNSGDCAKALAAGADFLMSGSLFSGCKETPGEIFWKYAGSYKTDEEYRSGYDNGLLKKHRPFKKYRGSASKESYEAQGKTAPHRAEEGESIFVPYKGPVKDVLQELEGGLRSALSYTDSRTLADFRFNAEFVRITSNTVVENGIRGAVK